MPKSKITEAQLAEFVPREERMEKGAKIAAMFSARAGHFFFRFGPLDHPVVQVLKGASRSDVVRARPMVAWALRWWERNPKRWFTYQGDPETHKQNVEAAAAVEAAITFWSALEEKFEGKESR